MKANFLGFDFAPVELSQNNLLSGFLGRHPQPLSGYTFATLAAWQEHFAYSWTLAEPDALFISCTLGSRRERHLMQPLGQFSRGLQDHLLSEAAGLPYDLRIVGVCDAFLKNHPDFVGRFAVKEDRAAANYVYRTEDLAKLPGRRYAKKRNLLAQASGLFRWAVAPLISERTDMCFSVLEDIKIAEQPEMDYDFQKELLALEYTLRHFRELDQMGIVVSIEARPVAFSIYERISPDTAAIHFERALRSYKGLYQVINCETARAIAEMGIEFINREEDIGNPGLRDAKLSYHPHHLVTAYELQFRR
jgi:uncharacterized protein